MTFGLTAEQWDELQSVLGRFGQIEACLLYGSRATGHHHRASDIDLALMGEDLTWSVLIQIKTAFEESQLPVFVDVLHYQSLSNDNPIKKQLDLHGVKIYVRGVRTNNTDKH